LSAGDDVNPSLASALSQPGQVLAQCFAAHLHQIRQLVQHHDDARRHLGLLSISLPACLHQMHQLAQRVRRLCRVADDRAQQVRQRLQGRKGAPFGIHQHELQWLRRCAIARLKIIVWHSAVLPEPVVPAINTCATSGDASRTRSGAPSSHIPRMAVNGGRGRPPGVSTCARTSAGAPVRAGPAIARPFDQLRHQRQQPHRLCVVARDLELHAASLPRDAHIRRSQRHCQLVGQRLHLVDLGPQRRGEMKLQPRAA